MFGKPIRGGLLVEYALLKFAVKLSDIFKIEGLTKPDSLVFEQMSDLHRQSFSPHWSSETIQQLYDPANSVCLLAKKCDKNSTNLLGFILIHFFEDIADILTFVVCQSNRNKGIGHLLLQSLFDVATTLGVTEIFLEVSEHNTQAIGLYEKSNFEIVTVRKRYYADGTDAILMRKRFDD